MPITFNRPEVTSNLIFITGKYDLQNGDEFDIDVSPYMNEIESVMTIPATLPTFGGVSLSNVSLANQDGDDAHSVPTINTLSQVVVNGKIVSIYHHKVNQDNMSTVPISKNSGVRVGNFCIIGRK